VLLAGSHYCFNIKYNFYTFRAEGQPKEMSVNRMLLVLGAVASAHAKVLQHMIRQLNYS
jgi:hypothetical protein